MNREKIAGLYGVHPKTAGIWLRKVRLSKLYPSIYDSKQLRKKKLNELLAKAKKSPNELFQRDFKNNKQENGRSYYGILTWYLSRLGYNFSQAREHFINEFFKESQ